jgi:hypothetical protein
LYVGLIGFPIIIILDAIIVIASPYTFVKIINLILVILASGAVGAFVREFFVRRNNERTDNSGE